MIIQLRLDERLIHGQIATSWAHSLGITAIVVANDDVANSELDKNLLMMSAPANVKVTIRTVDGAIKLLKDPRSEKMGILLICGNPKDTLRLAEALDIQDINIANYRKKKSKNKVTINTEIYADAEDFEVFKQICASGRNVFSQLLPSLSRSDFKAQVASADKNVK